MREVFAEIHATKVPELIVINKADAADPMVIGRLLAREPHSVVVSAKTGEGIEEALRRSSPSCRVRRCEFEALLPYERGDLLNRLHQQGEIGSLEHTGDGTLVAAGPTPTSRASWRRTPLTVPGEGRTVAEVCVPMAEPRVRLAR